MNIMKRRKDISDAKKYQFVRHYVFRERARRRIQNLNKEPVEELSCEAYGEIHTLVERQLMITQEGYGSWRELEDSEILDGAYRYAMQKSVEKNSREKMLQVRAD